MGSDDVTAHTEKEFAWLNESGIYLRDYFSIDNEKAFAKIKFKN